MTNLTTIEDNTKQLTKEGFYNTIFSANGREEKKQLLKDFSNTAKMILEMNPSAGETINEVIINCMYKNETHKEFNTFKKWKEKGFKVVKGSKSFFIWSKPRTVTKKSSEEDGEKEEFQMFGVAYLFSNAQVKKIEE